MEEQCFGFIKMSLNVAKGNKEFHDCKIVRGD